ncbi:tetratricopeptide repeat protein [Gordonia sp. LSe1-13]|uniref:Tetratricopeptide repeat protein n=1 Tax=Gordonia sesuvii TaxID=3116777 RepID=A0ABU7MFF7_9ACTN|nr:tetratricopeptide repeat protein [Gordonia sp. LSe1-13]
MTRTAYELALRAGPDSIILTPRSPAGLRRLLVDLDILSRLGRTTPVVLWLDRIDEFGKGDINSNLLKQCLKHAPGSRIIATIPSGAAYQAWTADNPEVAAEFRSPISLRRLPSIVEVRRAQSEHPEIDFSEGIAAAFVSLTKLLNRLASGFHQCPHEPDRGACDLATELVEVAIQWVGTGTTRPLPLARFSELSIRVGASPPDPAHLALVLEWATADILEGGSLLNVADERDGVLPDPRLAASLLADELHGPNASVWLAAIEEASNDSDAIGRISFTAHVSGQVKHRDAAWSHIDTLGEPGVVWLRRCIDYGSESNSRGGSLGALILLLDLQEAEFGPNHTEVAKTADKLGLVVLSTGDTQRARKLFERALRILQTDRVQNHAAITQTLNNIGSSHSAEGNFGTALGFHERALENCEDYLDMDHHGITESLTFVGNNLRALGKYREAVDMHRRALSINRQEHGPDHVFVGANLNNLGLALSGLDDIHAARVHFEGSLSIMERNFGRTHVEAAKVRDNLANIWHHLGDYIKAQDLHMQALHAFERDYGPDHIEVARALNNLGNALLAGRKYPEARKVFLRSSAAYRLNYGQDHVEVAKVSCNVAVSFLSEGNGREALVILEKSLPIIERYYGTSHVEVGFCLSNVAQARYAMGHRERARSVAFRALQVFRVHDYGNGVDSVREMLKRWDPEAIAGIVEDALGVNSVTPEDPGTKV